MDTEFRDDEIEILGPRTPRSERGTGREEPSPKSSRRWLQWCLLALLLVLVAVAAYFWLSRGYKPQTPSPFVEKKQEFNELQHKVEQASPLDSILEARIVREEKVVNDLKLNIYLLQNLKAGLSVGLPHDSIKSELLMLIQATDVRGDNGDILGECVIDGKALTRGKKPLGYVALLSGKISLGVDSTSTMYESLQMAGGSMFRQYSLVSKARMQSNNIKGQNYRRALAIRGEQLYLIESADKLSVHDFSEALQDLGLDEAIFLRRYDDRDMPLYYRESKKSPWQGAQPQPDSLSRETFLYFSI